MILAGLQPLHGCLHSTFEFRGYLLVTTITVTIAVHGLQKLFPRVLALGIATDENVHIIVESSQLLDPIVLLDPKGLGAGLPGVKSARRTVL